MEFKKPYLTDEQVQKNKEEFIGLFKELIIPAYDGADELLAWIEGSDFFTSPASTQYHMSCKGGLCQHSLNVFSRLMEFVRNEYGDKFEEELGVDNAGIALIALCHDLCKADTYTVETRNVKDENGVWVKEPYYKYSPKFELGHGEKSLFIVQTFIKDLSLNEASAIVYHMGAAGNPTSQVKDTAALKAMEDMNIVFWTHLADMCATYCDEKREPK